MAVSWKGRTVMAHSLLHLSEAWRQLAVCPFQERPQKLRQGGRRLHGGVLAGWTSFAVIWDLGLVGRVPLGFHQLGLRRSKVGPPRRREQLFCDMGRPNMVGLAVPGIKTLSICLPISGLDLQREHTNPIKHKPDILWP